MFVHFCVTSVQGRVTGTQSIFEKGKRNRRKGRLEGEKRKRWVWGTEWSTSLLLPLGIAWTLGSPRTWSLWYQPWTTSLPFFPSRASRNKTLCSPRDSKLDSRFFFFNFMYTHLIRIGINQKEEKNRNKVSLPFCLQKESGNETNYQKNILSSSQSS